MSIVSETVIGFLPAKRKTTPSGWTSFNAPCCVHNGTTADTRQRGGFIEQGETFSYHCFNCGYKTSWQPGRTISFKFKKLLEWLGVPDDVINKLAIEVIKLNEGIETAVHLVNLPEFTTVQLPPNAIKLKDIPDYNEHNIAFNYFLGVIEYMAARNLNMDDIDYYWSPNNGYRDRLIIPFYYENRIVGWTGRTFVKNKNPKYLTDSQPGFVFNLDQQTVNKAFCIVVEGPIDALHIEGTALCRAEINEQQAMLLNRLNKDIIVLPDRDSAGKKLVEQAIELGWSVSLPNWDKDCKDVSDVVQKHGKIYTLYSVVAAAESSPLKIRLGAKKWFDV